MTEQKNQPKEAPDFAQTQEAGFQFPLWGKIALLIAALSLAVIGYIKSGGLQNTDQLGADQEANSGLESRQTVPDVTLVDANGASKKLSDYKGKVVLLTFWAQWCTPCLVELPSFGQLQAKYGDRGFTIVAVNVDEGDVGKTFAKDFWRQKDFKFDSYFDESKATAEEFGVEVLPANFVLDRKGFLAFSGFGANDWTTAETAEMIEGLLKENP